uniref:F-box associated domain-containing protein n=1 Tax=Setaria viridis TaxID=4556 RepID=A0A4U6VQ73_SETVI|nr:hypothetical protein SEVIR_2G050100v2 [Setaria viridis]
MACGRSLGQDGPVRQEFRSAGALAAAGQESLACAGCGKIRWPVIRKTFIIAKWPDPPGHPTLPSRSVLRFRGVCKAWPDLFSDPNFVREHHRLQPDLPLVSFRRNASEELGEVDCRAEALDLHTATSVLEMEGKLAVFSCAEDVRVAEIWHLQDYKNQMWACKYHIELPALAISTLPDLDGGYIQEDWLRGRKSCGGRPQQRLLLSDMNGYLQERFRWDGCLLKITPCTFKESLVRMHSLRHRTM